MSSVPAAPDASATPREREVLRGRDLVCFGHDFSGDPLSKTHIMRLLVGIFTMGIPEHKLRCISPDVGGAFGSKIFCYADMALTLFASKAIGGRPSHAPIACRLRAISSRWRS